MKKNVVKINENTLRQIVAESVKKVLKEDAAYQMGRGEVSVDAAYQRIDKALDALKHIADTRICIAQPNQLYRARSELYS